MIIGLLITLLNPSITAIDREFFQEDIAVVKEVQADGVSICGLTQEDIDLLDYVLMGTRRGDNNGYTADDMYWLYQCIEAEEGINNHRAKYLSACCVLNRVRLGWSVSITGAIFSPYQFEVVRNNRIYSVKPTEDTIRACNEAVDNCEEWVIAFAMGDKHSKWADLVEVHNGEYYYQAR